jgi:tetratricopeptide (TPR) repeat protein
MISPKAILLATAMLATLLTACASSEQKPRPELIEQADKTISSGVYSYNQADYAKAEELFTKALYRYRGIDNPEGVASSCIDLAKTVLSQGDTDVAKQWIDSAQHVIETAGLIQLKNHVTIVSSSIAIETRDYVSAKQLLAPLLDDADKTIDTATRLAALQNRTRIAFAENNEAAVWTERYAKLVAPNEPLHQARLARFRAALATDDETGNVQYNIALTIYRKQAHRPGIAATLSEWAQREIETKQYDSAKDKLGRALFIRAELMDRNNCREILDLYARIYAATNNEDRHTETVKWIELLTSADFSQWQELTQAFSGFPDL